MQFLYPSFLWGLGLISIPIIIHLFNFRRVKKIFFSNTAFLTEITKKSKTRNQVKRFLILVARCLFITFLILAFAQPIFIKNGTETTNETTIYLDNSLSMNAQKNNGVTFLDEGIAMINRFIAINGDNYGYNFFTNDYNHVSNDLMGTDLTNRLLDVKLSVRNRSLSEIYSRMVNEGISSDVLLISDFTHDWSLGLEEIESDTSRRFSLINVSDEDQGNLYVDSVYINFSIENTATRNIHIILKNEGNQRREDVLIKVFKDNLQVSSFTIEIEKNSRLLKEVDFGSMKEIHGRYRIEVEDPSVSFDNTYFFYLPPPTKPNITLLFQQGGEAYIGDVFSNQELFALSKQNFKNISYQEVKQADLLILSQMEVIPEWLSGQLAEHQKVMVIPPAENIDIASYSTFLGFDVNINQEDSVSETISRNSLDHSLFRNVFKDLTDRTSLPSVKLKYSVSGYSEPVLQTNLKNDFIVRTGNKQLFFMTTPLEDRFTNFHKHALFVPVMYQLARSESDYSGRLAHSLDEQMLELSFDSLINEEVVSLQNESDAFITTVIKKSGVAYLNVPDGIKNPGFYYLISKEDTISTFAFNYPENESVIHRNREVLQELASRNTHITYLEAEDEEIFEAKIREEREGRELWKYALLLALMFLITEMLLLRFTK